MKKKKIYKIKCKTREGMRHFLHVQQNVNNQIKLNKTKTKNYKAFK